MERYKYVRSYTNYTTHCQVYMCLDTLAIIHTSNGGNRMGAGYPSSPGRWVQCQRPGNLSRFLYDEMAIRGVCRGIEKDFEKWIEAKKAVASSQ